MPRLLDRRTLVLAALGALGCSSPTTAGPGSGESATPKEPATSSEPSTDVAARSPSPPAPPMPTAEVAPAPPTDAMRPPTPDERTRYPWLPDEIDVRPLNGSFAPPSGYRRVPLEADTFGAWLRELPLRAPGTPVNTYDGRLLRRGDDPRIAAVAELDLSERDLQQCADSVIRLHAEWMWSRGRAAEVGYHFLSGDYATWSRYAAGERPAVDGARVVWSRSARPSTGRKTFRRYLDMVFNYASTISLARRRTKIDRAQAAPGDFFVLPGGPGHAVLILDVAEADDGRRVALLGQGFLPAQDFQVLRGPRSAWFSLDGDAVDTPFWEPFPWTALRRM